MRAESVTKWLVARVMRSRLTRPLAAPTLRLVQYALGLTQREVVSFRQRGRSEAAARVREIVTGFPTQTMNVDEAYLIRSAVLATASIPGDLAEVGVFRGGTARIICEAKGARTLHLFDTFEGLPAPAGVDQGFAEGQYACDLPSVQEYLAAFSHVHFYPGLFPTTGDPVRTRSFSFVHLDVDLYRSTLDALHFFYPRLSVGGILISHDYVEFEAVRRAFTDYFATLSQPVLELTGNQCLVWKLAPSPSA
jgi:hypothetical protein